MSNRVRKAGRFFLSIFLSAATAITLSGSSLLVPVAVHAQGLTLSQLIELLISLDIIPPSKAAAARAVLQDESTAKCTFTKDLAEGATGDDVKCLQQYLNGAGFKVANSGPGSPGNETMYFGSLTRGAVSSWQVANNVSPTAGYFGSISRAKYNALVAVTPPVRYTSPWKWIRSTPLSGKRCLLPD